MGYMRQCRFNSQIFAKHENSPAMYHYKTGLSIVCKCNMLNKKCYSYRKASAGSNRAI